jgi:hypothetical protein
VRLIRSPAVASGRRLGLPLLAIVLLAGCSPRLEESFDLMYLAYGKVGAPDGVLVHARHHADGSWTHVAEQPLSRAAVLLIPGPFPAADFQYLTISSGYLSKTSALWEVPLDSGLVLNHSASFRDRALLLVDNNPTATAAAVVFVTSSQVDLRTAEFGREAVSLRANFRCSVAVIRYERPDSLEVLSECAYARAAWLSDTRVAFIHRSGTLVACDLDSAVCDTLASGVEAISAAPGSERYAVAFRGDSVSVRATDGTDVYPTLHGASVPQLAGDGAHLAYHTPDLGVWSVELATGETHELGVGYPIDWSSDGGLLLFYERELDDRNVARSIFHLADPRTGAAARLPDDGFIVDAVFLP